MGPLDLLHYTPPSELKEENEFKLTIINERRGSDIALVRLTGIINYKDGIYPVCLPWRQLETIGLTAKASGWGTTGSGVDIQILENRVCHDWFTEARKYPKLKDTQLCAGYQAWIRDSCW
ncbi:hypothetical protein QYM36_000462, partial [Artemia franciscana]